MITVTCQYTGIEFEATSKRQKNHPKVSDLLNAAAKDGGSAYNVAKQRFAEARERGMTDIDGIVRYVETGVFEANRESNERARQRAEEERERKLQAKYRRNEREYVNGILREHGYRWQRYAVGTDDEWSGNGSYYGGVGEFSHWSYTLVAPDGREVTVHQALQELTDNDPRAADWVKTHPA